MKDISNKQITDDYSGEELFVIVTWPESQYFIDRDDCYLICDDKGVEEFGSSAYFVPLSVIKDVENNNDQI